MGCSGSVGGAKGQEGELAEMATKAEKLAGERIRALCVPDQGKAVRIAVSGRASYVPGDRVVVSFPGVHGYAWNYLMQHCNEMDGIKTSCVWMADEDSPGFGAHHLVSSTGQCACQQLYDGEKRACGCTWYEAWKSRTDKAARRGCELIVVTKADGSLGRSQKAEMIYLKNMRYSFRKVSIEQFVTSVWEPVLKKLRNIRAMPQPAAPSPAESRATTPSSDGGFPPRHQHQDLPPVSRQASMESSASRVATPLMGHTNTGLSQRSVRLSVPLWAALGEPPVSWPPLPADGSDSFTAASAAKRRKSGSE